MARGHDSDLTGVVLEERYRLGGQVGRGGMGVVYEAEQLRVGRRCAVKVLHGGQHADSRVRMRFFREARATSRVRHPNVVEVIDFGEDSTVGSYMVMEFIDGMSLSKIISLEAPIPFPAAYTIMTQLCSALSATHVLGLVHRDLKPSNVVRMKNGVIKVLDFGLVKPVAGQTCADNIKVTTDNVILGTPWYMSPEHCRGEVLDGRADVYALGIIFFEMLTGKLPFDGLHPLEVIDKQLHAALPRPIDVNPGLRVSPSMELVLFKTLAKDRNQRYQSVHELSDALHTLCDEQGFSSTKHDTVTFERCADGTTMEPPSRSTIRWSGAATPSSSPAPPALPTPPLNRLQELAISGEQQLVDQVTEGLAQAFPRFREIDQKAVRRRVARGMRGAISVLVRDSRTLGPLDFDVSDSDAAGGVASLTEVVTSLWLGYLGWRPLLLEASDRDLAQYLILAEQFDQRILPFFFHVVDRYVAAYQGKMQRLNQTLAGQNEELQSLHESLHQQVDHASRQLADAERLKAQVTEIVPVGLLLTERDSRRVLMWNKSLEKLTGIPAAQVVGEPIDAISHLIKGIPFDEFYEQLMLHGEVGLRKLRLTFKGTEERSVYVRGYPFKDPQGQRSGLLVVIEDVTEREQVIESLGRYLSRDLVTRIMSRGTAPQPDGERRRAIILAAKLRRLPETLDHLEQADVIRVLNMYVRAVSHAVFGRGGTIEQITPNGLIAYFSRLGDSGASAVEAAVELAQRILQIDEQLGIAAPGLSLSVGLHVGDVLVLNVGGDQLMVQTVVGEAARTAVALRNAAGAGEILLSAALAEIAGDQLIHVGGPEISVPGRDVETQSVRVIYEPIPDLDPDPVTLVTGKP